jgi:L-arabinose isomerase
VARAVWQPRPDLATAATAWLTAGGSHHTVLTQGLGVEPLADFAEMAGIEFLLVDSSTTLGNFSKELRWNKAYYRLAGRL